MKTKFLTLAFFFIISLVSFSQKGVSNFSIAIEPQGIAPITPLMSMQEVNMILDTMHQKVFFLVTLQEAEATKVYVRLGSDSTFSKVNTFVLTNGASLPSGMTFSRTDNALRIGLGTLTGLSHYIAEVQVESAAGILSRKYQIIH